MLLASTPKKIFEPPGPRNGFDADAALRSIFAGTAAKTGKQFFAALVKNLALAMNTHGAWVTEYFPEARQLRALAFWFGGKLIPNYQYNIDGTLCEVAIERRELVHFADNVLELYPGDLELKEAGVVSYMGVPLLDMNDQVLGHLAVVDTKPMPQEPRAVAIFQIFAARAAAELQRLYVEAELRAKNAQLEKAQALLEAENRHKTDELERARRLQLALVPKEIPQLPNFEIDVYMKTATEVGGDYYDFQMGKDGALTVVIGDATGHGLNAGMMVTATKSILTTLREEPDLVKVFKQLNEALRRVNLLRHYMALQMIQLKGERLVICSAGMPPLLLYRAASQTIEKFNLKAMPLGSVANFPYQKREAQIASGDTILLMSDGFTELFNAAGEIFDEEQVQAAFAEVATQSPQQIIKHLVNEGEKWAKGEPPHDDITFVALKVRCVEKT